MLTLKRAQSNYEIITTVTLLYFFPSQVYQTLTINTFLAATFLEKLLQYPEAV